MNLSYHELRSFVCFPITLPEEHCSAGDLDGANYGYTLLSAEPPFIPAWVQSDPASCLSRTQILCCIAVSIAASCLDTLRCAELSTLP